MTEPLGAAFHFQLTPAWNGIPSANELCCAEYSSCSSVHIADHHPILDTKYFYCKTRCHINSSITFVGLFGYIVALLSANSGSCIGQWAESAITIFFGVLTSLLIMLLTVAQCTVIVGGEKIVQLKRMAFSLMVIWINSSMWGIFSYVIFAVD